MRQRSLFDIGLAELMPGIRTAMRRVAADKEGEGREVLWRRGMGFKDVAARIGITPQAVSATIVGKNHSAIVLDALREIGVPEELLHDPRRVEVVGKEAA